MQVKKLNLGCGTDIKKGWINLDSAALPGVDIVHNLDTLPLPFRDASMDEILCQDVLEHTEYIPLLKELHRLLMQGGKLVIRVPHFTSHNNFVDPTHKKRFSVSTFAYFTEEDRNLTAHNRGYYFDFHFTRIASLTLTFDRWSRIFFLNRFVAPVVNHSRRTQSLYEATGWSRIFPAQNLLITLIK